MTSNNYMTQPERVEFHLQLLEEHQKLNEDLYKLLPYYVRKVSDTQILFFNNNGEVIIDFLNDLFYNIRFNVENDKNFYQKEKNFDYLFIEHKLEENIIYFFDEKLSKKDIPKYIERVRAFLALLPN